MALTAVTMPNSFSAFNKTIVELIMKTRKLEFQFIINFMGFSGIKERKL